MCRGFSVRRMEESDAACSSTVHIYLVVSFHINASLLKQSHPSPVCVQNTTMSLMCRMDRIVISASIVRGAFIPLFVHQIQSHTEVYTHTGVHKPPDGNKVFLSQRLRQRLGGLKCSSVFPFSLCPCRNP